MYQKRVIEDDEPTVEAPPTMRPALFAEIRRDSKYAGQAEAGVKFPVGIDACHCTHMLKGGPGGAYRVEDVHLYAQTAEGVLVQLT